MATADITTDNSGRQRIAVKIALREKGLIKQVPGARYDGELQSWTTRLSYTACAQLSGIFKTALVVSPELQEYAANGFRLSAEAKARGVELDAVVPHWRQAELSPLQRVGADFLINGSAILADEMGGGKTVQATVALSVLSDGAERFHGLVVCPNSVKRVWARHVEGWTLDLEVFVLKGSKGQREKILAEYMLCAKAVLVVNWEQLKAHSRLAPYGNIRLSDEDRRLKELNIPTFDVIIADEAHRLKNPSSQQSRACFALRANRRWALTGTPIANHPGDFWSILRFVDPDEWPSRSQYIDRYCVSQWNVFGGSDIIGINHTMRDEFYHLIDRYFIRRLKRDLMGREITKTAEVRYVELPAKHRRMYNEFKAELLLMLDADHAVAATNQLAATSRLVQLSAAPLGISPVDPNQLVMLDPSPKVKELLSLIDDLDEPLVVFSSSKQLLYLAADALEKDGVPYLLATGDQSEEVRGDAVDRFQAGESRVFLATTGAMSEGVTLTRAKVLCFLHRDWSMVKNSQAEDRIHRWGQEADAVTIIDIITEDTIDERVYDVFVTKKGRLDEVTRDSWKDLI